LNEPDDALAASNFDPADLTPILPFTHQFLNGKGLRYLYVVVGGCLAGLVEAGVGDGSARSKRHFRASEKTDWVEKHSREQL
jgi:hypothetical protein